MIIGVGCDLIEIKRIEKACGKEAFLKKVYTERELAMSGDRFIMLADNFAVKEAVSKAFGTGIRRFVFKDIEVLRDEYGKPVVNLHGNALKRKEELKIDNIEVSISNTDDLSLAFCVAERNV